MLIALAALLGAIMGSFIATWTQRIGEGRSITGRSACDQCHRTLRPWELVPLISFAATRGRCQRCGGPIAPRHLYIELAAALIGVVALVAQPDWAGAAGALFGWQLLTLAVTDAELMRLPNGMTAGLALTGLAAGLCGLDPPLIERLIGAVAGFGILTVVALLYKVVRKRDGMGGGDPKMLGAIGAWLGPLALGPVLLLASLIGLGSVAIRAIRGQHVEGAHALPFGSLMAVAAFAIWITGWPL